MALTYTKIEDVPGRTRDGLDRLRRSYRVKYATADEVIAAEPGRNSSDSVFGGMHLIESNVTENASSSPRLDRIYEGFFNSGSLPPVRVKQGVSLATVSTTDGSLQLEVLYRSPTTTYSWIDTVDDNIRYSGVSNPLDLEVITRRVGGHVPPVWRISNIITAAPSAGTAQLTDVEDYLAQNEDIVEAVKQLIIDYFNLVFSEDEEVTSFTAEELVPGQFFRCNSVSSKVLVPF